MKIFSPENNIDYRSTRALRWSLSEAIVIVGQIESPTGKPANVRTIWIADANKAKSNLGKHGISFEEASAVFGDRRSLTIPDPVHSEVEERFASN